MKYILIDCIRLVFLIQSPYITSLLLHAYEGVSDIVAAFVNCTAGSYIAYCNDLDFWTVFVVGGMGIMFVITC